MNQDQSKPEGRLFVVSGPSGSGKSSILKAVLQRDDIDAQLSISATSRPQRPGEIDGKDYWFITKSKFEELRDQNAFLEWALVHDNYYGTPALDVHNAINNGKCIVLEIDVQGAIQVLERMPEATTVFIKTADLETLEARLRARGTEDDATIRRRLANAHRELEQSYLYTHMIINREFDRAVAELTSLLVNLGCRGKERS